MRSATATTASLCLAAALLAMPGLTAAAIPTGSFELEFGGRQSIWLGDEDGSGGEEFCEEFAADFDDLESCDFQGFVDGKGKIYGSLEFAGWSGGVHFDLGGPIKGSQKGDDRTGIARVSFSVKLTGVATDGFVSASTKASLRYSGQTMSDGLTTGVLEAKVCISGVGCQASQSPTPPEVLTDGGWSLELEIVDGGSGRLGGAARVEFESGGDCLYALSGKYSASKDVASLKLAPTEMNCAGTSLQLKDVRLWSGPPADVSGSISYKMFGFRGATLFGVLPVSAEQAALLSHYSNQPLFVYICHGTTTIAASTDPSACSWSVFSEATVVRNVEIVAVP
jgi:hypothetical protein